MAAQLGLLLESSRDLTHAHLGTSVSVCLISIMLATMMAVECGQYPCGKYYVRPRRTPLWS